MQDEMSGSPLLTTVCTPQSLHLQSIVQQIILSLLRLCKHLIRSTTLFTSSPLVARFIYCSNYVPGQAPMHPGRVVTTFVAADGICEMLMSTGVGQIVNYQNPTKVAIGGGLIKVRPRLTTACHLHF